MSLGRVVGLAGGVLLALFVLMSIGKIFENVSANELVVIQAPWSGKLTWTKQSGVALQLWGTVTSYPRRQTYVFEIPVRFNDGGHGTMQGSVQWEMPLSDAQLTMLHQQFGSPEAIQQQLISTVVNKAAYMTGPLMSSKESYAEKRNYLINYVEDQIAHGVYRTIQREIKVADPLTGQDKSAIVVDILMNSGVPQRQEASILDHYGIVTSNFAIKGLPYDPEVEKQIQQQQQITMQVQTAIAESRQAEQRAITVAKQGEADAAKAKWEQETIKAKAVTEAEQQLAVQTLRNQTAEQYRQEQLKKADGDAGYRRQVMAADGALAQKLDALVKINATWAAAFKDYPGQLVPSVVMGNGQSGTTGIGATQNFMDILTAKAAQDLGVSLKQQPQSGKGGLTSR